MWQGIAFEVVLVIHRLLDRREGGAQCLGPRRGRVFTQGWLQHEEEWLCTEPHRKWDLLLGFRGEVNRALEKARSEKLLPSSSAAHLLLSGPGAKEIGEALGPEELAQLFLTASVEISDAPPTEADCVLRHDTPDSQIQIHVFESTNHKCARCWRFAIPAGEAGVTDICARCAAVVGL